MEIQLKYHCNNCLRKNSQCMGNDMEMMWNALERKEWKLCKL